MSAIPEWNPLGILPPVHPGVSPAARNRTPYRADLLDFLKHFSGTLARIELLEGFLEYRKALHGIGIVSGFQWINGSFAENIELLEGRDPRDIDCVTFYVMPDREDEESLYYKNPHIFNHNEVKSTFHVDSYYITIEDTLTQEMIENITYWYSMWSHRRDLVWKGFIQLDIDPAQDKEAHRLLENLKAELQS